MAHTHIPEICHFFNTSTIFNRHQKTHQFQTFWHQKTQNSWFSHQNTLIHIFSHQPENLTLALLVVLVTNIRYDGRMVRQIQCLRLHGLCNNHFHHLDSKGQFELPGPIWTLWTHLDPFDTFELFGKKSMLIRQEVIRAMPERKHSLFLRKFSLSYRWQVSGWP